MRIKIALWVAIFISGISTTVLANEEQERIYLTQMLNQLQAIKPLVVAAAKEQPKENRIQFHYTRYRDVNGKIHNGLIEDINEIENGIKEKISQPSAPHTFNPIRGDYVDHHDRSSKAW